MNFLKEWKVRFQSKLFFICLFERNLLFDSLVVLFGGNGIRCTR